MAKYFVQVLFCALAAILVTTSIYFPEYLSDKGNVFLRDFLDSDILAVLGFITALANASILSIYLHLNYLDDEVGFSGKRVRRGLKISGLSLIVVFMIAFVILILKPIVPSYVVLNAVLNSFGILCVVFSLSVLRDILLTVMRIPSKREIKKIQEENRKRISGVG